MATLNIDRQKELLSVSETPQHLSGLLTKLRDKMASKFFLAKNNTIEAVLLPIEEYEKLLDIEAELDHLILHHEITMREKIDAGKRLTLHELGKKYAMAG